jgi:hypothetical protein
MSVASIDVRFRGQSGHQPALQRAAELMLAEAAVAAFSKQLELALFLKAKLDIAGMA